MIKVPLGCGGFIEEICKSTYITGFNSILIFTIIGNVLFFLFGNLLPTVKKWNWSSRDLAERVLLAFNIYVLFRFLSSVYLEWFIKYKMTIIIFGVIVGIIYLIVFIAKNYEKIENFLRGKK